MSGKRPRILAFATLGSGTSDEERLRALLAEFDPEFFPFDRLHKLESFRKLVKTIFKSRPDLVCLEGTGIAGGAALLLTHLTLGTRYLVSSGDAVGPFISARNPSLGPLFNIYEKMLCRRSSGFIGWSPYLTGRALSFGARHAMTAAGWSPFSVSPAEALALRAKTRAQLGIGEGDRVIGIAGSLAWNPRVQYCYGLELVRALTAIPTSPRAGGPQLHALIVGDGEGRERLAALAGARLGRTIHLTGRVPRTEIPAYLAAMDLASLPQSVDAVGSFRYTTKLSEYLALRLPVVTGRIPLAYDLPGDWLWRLPGDAPWEKTYTSALGALLTRLNPEEIAMRKEAIPHDLPIFNESIQKARVSAFISDILDTMDIVELSK